MIQAFQGFFTSFRFILRHRLWWLFLAPAVLWILLAILFFMVLEGPVDRLTVWIAAQLDLPDQQMDDGFWRDAAAVLDGAREVIVLIVLKIAIAYLLFTFNKYIVLILLSPLLAYASEKAEEIITGRSHAFDPMQLLKDAVRGSMIALRNGVFELVISIAIWALTFVLPFGIPLSVVLLFLVSAYFYGFSMFDYVFERHRLGMAASTREVNKRLPLVITNGALFSLLMKVPLLGMTLAPGMAAVGAVLALKRDELMAPRSDLPPAERSSLRG